MEKWKNALGTRNARIVHLMFHGIQDARILDDGSHGSLTQILGKRVIGYFMAEDYRCYAQNVRG